MSKMTKSLVAASVLAATVASGAAMADVSMNIGAASNYMFRGMSASGNQAAISGGIDYSHDSGFYAGAWNSNLGGGNPASETDLYLGFGGSFGDVGYDVSATNIMYTDMKDWDYTEANASVSYSYFTVGLNATVASTVKDTKYAEQYIDGDLHTYISASVPVGNDYSVGATFGNYTFADDGKIDVNTGLKADYDYTYYTLSVTKSAGDYGDVTLQLDQTDVKDDKTTTDIKEDAPVVSVSWSKSF